MAEQLPRSEPPAAEPGVVPSRVSPLAPEPAPDDQPRGAAHPKYCPECAGRYPADFRVCPRDAAPLEDAPEDDDPLLGSTLGGSYEVLRVIGEGGMGRVYEATHLRLRNKRFAIKVLHHEYARQPEIVSRFQREAEASSALDHPNVIQVFDVNQTPDGRPYIVAELLTGENLGVHLDRVGRLPVGRAVHIVRQICRALGQAHAHGIVHRDIKPENVFLTGDGARPRVKVLDFGISKVGDGRGSLTRTGVVMGTPAYMAPEQARGQHVDHRADLYAVGAILYRALTGGAPFDDLDPLSTLTAVVTREPRRPSTIEPSISAELELAVQRAMAKEPSSRHDSVLALEAELAGFADAGDAADLELGSDAALPTADTVRPPSHAGLAAPQDLQRSSGARVSSIARVRAHLVVLSICALLWSAGALFDLLATSVGWLRETRYLSGTDLALCVASTLALLATPVVFWVRHLAQQVWPSTPRALATLPLLRGALLTSVVGYAVVALGARSVSALGDGDLAGSSSRGYVLLELAAALLGAGLGLARERSVRDRVHASAAR